MTYDITIEGGIMGTLKNYQGELPQGYKFLSDLKAILKHPVAPSNERIRDGFKYSFKLYDKDQNFASEFDEQNLPAILRELIEYACKK